jgi:hypothetical protein
MYSECRQMKNTSVVFSMPSLLDGIGDILTDLATGAEDENSNIIRKLVQELTHKQRPADPNVYSPKPKGNILLPQPFPLPVYEPSQTQLQQGEALLCYLLTFFFSFHRTASSFCGYFYIKGDECKQPFKLTCNTLFFFLYLS